MKKAQTKFIFLIVAMFLIVVCSAAWLFIKVEFFDAANEEIMRIATEDPDFNPQVYEKMANNHPDQFNLNFNYFGIIFFIMFMVFTIVGAFNAPPLGIFYFLFQTFIGLSFFLFLISTILIKILMWVNTEFIVKVFGDLLNTMPFINSFFTYWYFYYIVWFAVIMLTNQIISPKIKIWLRGNS